MLVYFVLIQVVSTEFLTHLQSLLVCCGCDIVTAMTSQLAKEAPSAAVIVPAVVVPLVLIVIVIVVIIIIYVVHRRRQQR